MFYNFLIPDESFTLTVLEGKEIEEAFSFLPTMLTCTMKSLVKGFLSMLCLKEDNSGSAEGSALLLCKSEGHCRCVHEQKTVLVKQVAMEDRKE